MRALLLIFALSACAALEEQAPVFDTAATKAQQTGGCVKIKCELPLTSLSDCRPGVGRCHRD